MLRAKPVCTVISKNFKVSSLLALFFDETLMNIVNLNMVINRHKFVN